ncbi:MAG: uroporphyrinogen-III synthase [Elusimicrobiota bacterium]
MSTSRRALNGRTVIVTGTNAVMSKLNGRLRSMGATVVAAPLIRISPPRSYRRLDASLGRLADFDAVVFASANAVEAFFVRSASVLGKKPVAPRFVSAVGPATAAALAARGWRATVVPEVRRAEGLARALRLPPGSRVLIPRAERGREALPRLLKAAGHRIIVVSAYRTAPDHTGRRRLRSALSAGADAACFASGSAVESAAVALGTDRMRRTFRVCAAVAIGPVTAAVLRRRGVTASVARSADDRAMTDAVVRALRRKS